MEDNKINRFENGQIYKIVSDNTLKIYIGSTCLKLDRRLKLHISSFKLFQNGKLGYNMGSFELLALGEVNIVLLEKKSCQNKKRIRNIRKILY